MAKQTVRAGATNLALALTLQPGDAAPDTRIETDADDARDIDRMSRTAYRAYIERRVIPQLERLAARCAPDVVARVLRTVDERLAQSGQGGRALPVCAHQDDAIKHVARAATACGYDFDRAFIVCVVPGLVGLGKYYEPGREVATPVWTHKIDLNPLSTDARRPHDEYTGLSGVWRSMRPNGAYYFYRRMVLEIQARQVFAWYDAQSGAHASDAIIDA